MRVRVEQVPARWDALLGGTRHDVYHTAGYQRFAAGMDEGDPYLIVIGDSDRGLAWPYVLRRVDVMCGLADAGTHDVGSFHGYTGPVVWGLEPDDPFITGAFELVQRTWREQGAVSAYMRFHPLLDNAVLGTSRLDGGADTIEPLGETISIDCSIGDGEAVSGYARVLRQEIAQARRAGLETEPDPDWAHLETFVRLYSDSLARKRAPSAFWVSAPDIRRMRDELGGRLHLFMTHIDGTVVGAGIFSEYQGFVDALMVGTDETYRRWSPLKVMLDDVRRWAHERGDAVLHLGGGRAGRRDSLFEFKCRFSRRRHALHIGRWILDPDRYQDLVQVRKRRLAENGLSIADTSWFPAYRSPVTTLEVADVDGQRHPEPVTIPVARNRVAITVDHRPSPSSTPWEAVGHDRRGSARAVTRSPLQEAR